MKTILILLLLPVAGYGQSKTANNLADGVVTCLHYDTAAVNGPVTVKDDVSEDDRLKTVKDDITYRGNVEFKIGFTDIRCDEAVSNENKKVLSARGVRISCLYYPLLKGDHLIYNKATKQAVLYGPVTIVDKGAEKNIGNIAYLDLSHDRYIINPK